MWARVVTDEPSRRTNIGALFGVIGAMVVWGSAFVVTKATAEEFPPLTLAFLRFVVASLVLVPIMLARGSLATLPQPWPLGRLAMLAFTGVVLFTVAFNYALVYGSASQGTLIYALVPAAVSAAAAVFLGEHLHGRRIAGMLVSLAGVAVVVAFGQSNAATPASLVGGLFMLAAVIAWTMYTIMAKPLAAADQTAVVAVISVMGAAMLLPPAGIELAIMGLPNPSAMGWLGLAYLGVLASAGAYLVYNLALRYLQAGTVGALTNIDPVAGLLAAIVVLGESLTWLQSVGAAAVLTGMWLSSTEGRRAEDGQSPGLP
jgi:drug/metabolite transporter (DMT)-like permease